LLRRQVLKQHPPTRKCYHRSQPRSQGFRMRTRRDTRKPWSGPVT
jgi:hypothetical protein